MFLLYAAQSLRTLALSAPEIANELRRFADELESEAAHMKQHDREPTEDAA